MKAFWRETLGMVPVVLGFYAVVFIVSGVTPPLLAVGSMGLVLVLAAGLAVGWRLCKEGYRRGRWVVGMWLGW